MKASLLFATSIILSAVNLSAAPILTVGVPANSILATPTASTPSSGTLFNFDTLTPNSIFNPGQYAARGVSISSPDGLLVEPFSTQTSPNELFDNNGNGSADITIRTNATNQVAIGIADSDGVTVMLQALNANGTALGSAFSVTLPTDGANPGNGYFAVSDSSYDIYGLQILQPSTDANFSGLAIDDLRVTAAPEPFSCGLLGAASLLFVVGRLRKRSSHS